jgi:chromosome segregation ATPase
MLEERLAAARKEFDDKADGIRAGADATIESMAAESSRIQLDYKKTHNVLREEAEALRKELTASQQALRDMRVEVEATAQLELRDAVEKELGAKFKSEFDAKLDARLGAELQDRERLEASYSAKIDMLLKEKQESDARVEGMNAELEIAKEQLSKARQDSEHAERELAGLRQRGERLECEQRDQLSASIEATNLLEKVKAEHRRETSRLMETVANLEDALRAAKQDASERDEVLRRARLKEQEANLTISKYNEMTEKREDLLKTYAPGLGAGGFLGRGIARMAIA